MKVLPRGTEEKEKKKTRKRKKKKRPTGNRRRNEETNITKIKMHSSSREIEDFRRNLSLPALCVIVRSRVLLWVCALIKGCKGIGWGHRVSPAGLPTEQVLGEYSLS